MEGIKQRKLVAIMFTDIVGYSGIMQENEETGILIRKRHRKIFEELTSKYDGELIQYFGDGTLSIFPSAATAVECAVEMQRNFKEDPKVPLRIGIHTGDITFTSEDAYGHGMNIAARIEPMCIPGGVYISGKVYEDISNHQWLKATSLGYFELKNINDAIEIFAVGNEGVKTPEYEVIDTPDEEYFPHASKQSGLEFKGSKRKRLAGFLAFFFGIFGVHRYYLGQQKLGIAYFVSAIIGIIAGVWFMIAIPAIIGFIDAVTMWSMSREEFDSRYNEPKAEPRRRKKEYIPTTFRKKKASERMPVEEYSGLTLEQKAQKAYRIGDFDAAIQYYSELIKKDPDNGENHFTLASSYSMNEDAKKGFYHLSRAVESGYDNFKKIKNHFTLAFLRSRNDFKAFEKNGFRLVKMLPSPQEDLLESERPLLLKKLEEIEELGQLLHKGAISEEEFATRKRSILEE